MKSRLIFQNIKTNVTWMQKSFDCFDAIIRLILTWLSFVDDEWSAECFEKMRCSVLLYVNKLIRTNVFKIKVALTAAWIYCWKKVLTQNQIRTWIERISNHLTKIIELKDDNEYREGRGLFSNRLYVSETRARAYARRKKGIKPGDADDLNIESDEWIDC